MDLVPSTVCSGLLDAELISLPQFMSYDPFLCIYNLVPSFHPAKETFVLSALATPTQHF